MTTTSHHSLVALRKLIVDVAATPDLADPDSPYVEIDDVTAERVAAAVLAEHIAPAPLSDPAVARAYLAPAQHPHIPDEWCHGRDRGVWLGGHEVNAWASPDLDGHVVGFNRHGLSRDALPGLIAFLTAVYVVSDPAVAS